MRAYSAMSPDRVFVTGGRGFVGSAIVRRLLASDTPISLLTRHGGDLAPDVARRVDVVAGALASHETIARSLAGCGALVHCAKSDDADVERRHATDVHGVTSLLLAAREAGVRRFVHLSTISVYPILPNGCIDESTPYGQSTDAYSVDKRACDAAVLAPQNECEVIVLQPANIYGPGRNWWTTDLLNLMRQGRVIRVNGGSGVANLVHVDDVAAAAELAVNGRGVPGERYLLTDGHPRPWREYFEALERIVGHPATVSMSVDEAKRYSRKIREMSLAGRVVNAMVRAVSRQSPIFPTDDDAIDRFASEAVCVIDRARRELGYAPSVTLDASMSLLPRTRR